LTTVAQRHHDFMASNELSTDYIIHKLEILQTKTVL